MTNDYECEKRLSIGFFAAIIAIISILIPIIVLGGISISTYNDLVKTKESVKYAKSEVETQMQRRLELIPDLVETTKSAAKHEKSVYQSIANARSVLNDSIENGDTVAMDEANKQLTLAIENYLNIITESYPEIAASEQYTNLMDQLEGSINRITIARENYNKTVNTYNTKIKVFPSILFAKVFCFEYIEPFKSDKEASDTNMVNFN